ncbi:MAG TPA: hypothetical protein GXX23_03060 [Firmicutes bacterium]|nr:hypothetical protein [Candidatus Fermentithermobacillaceae bacterium]
MDKVGKKPARPMDVALRALARRRMTSGQMRNLLLKRGCGQEESEQCIEQLSSWGYLDDRGYAKDLLRFMLSDCPVGKQRAIYDLVKRGFDRDLAEEAAAEAYGDVSEAYLARRAASKYLNGRKAGSLKDRDRERLFRWLWRRGFEADAIYAALRDEDEQALT